MTEKDFLREQLQLLTKAHYDAVQPIIRRLAAIEAMTVPLYAFNTETKEVRSIPPCQSKNFDGSPAYPEGLDVLAIARGAKQGLVLGWSFAQAWAEKEREGYRYGPAVLESVKFGWDLACGVLASGDLPPSPAVRRDCSCFPGTCREQVGTDGVTVSGNYCKALVPAR